MNQFSRTELLIGKENVEKLHKAKVAIFGIGGVGSFVAEGLVRAGVGNFLLVDNDTVSETNINRQIIANSNTIGKYKVDLMKDRMLTINKNVKVEISKEFYLPNKNINIDKSFDYVVDTIDTITAKIGLIEQAKSLNVSIISCMGTGNKLDPTKFEIEDIYKTSVCPLAKVIRKELKKRNISNLKVLYSKEEPIVANYTYENEDTNGNTKKQVPASISFVPSVAGLIIAGEVVKDLCNL